MKQVDYEPINTYKMNIRGLLFLPIMILLGVIPLIVRMVKTDISDERILYLTNNNIDLFSQAKSTMIFVIVGIILLAAFLSYNKTYIKKDKIAKIYYISSLAFVGTTLLATWLSAFPDIAKWGLPNRAEGGVMIVCYVIIMVYTFNIVITYKDYRYIIFPLGILTVILAILGYYQYIGEDLLMTDWGKSIIIPEYYAQDREFLKPLYKDKRMYGTLFHYNYVGSFTAMTVPLFGVLAFFVKNYKWKIFCGIGSILSLFLLFGSTARSGLIGLALSLGVACILFGRYFVKLWKVLLVAASVGIVLVIGLNTATKGAIFSRIPQLMNDMVKIISPADESFDYKASLPLKDIRNESGTTILDLGLHELHIGIQDERLRFTDENGEEVIFIFMDWGNEKSNYFTQDERFKDYRFTIEALKEKEYIRLVYKDRYVARFSVEQGVYFVDHFTKEPVAFVEPETFGFKGKEKLGSARGYIWSRSLPLFKDTWLLGTGPDTFGFYFPQNDILGKWYAYNNPNVIVDKAHNLYLQIGIQQGGIALLAFLVLIGAYLVQSFSLYGFKKCYDEQHIIGMAFMLAIVGYLGAGLFNDSVVSVAPIFWVLLGCGMAINYTLRAKS